MFAATPLLLTSTRPSSWSKSRSKMPHGTLVNIVTYMAHEASCRTYESGWLAEGAWRWQLATCPPVYLGVDVMSEVRWSHDPSHAFENTNRSRIPVAVDWHTVKFPSSAPRLPRQNCGALIWAHILPFGCVNLTRC